VVGDQQAALFGQAAFAPGESKCTYGTGAFFLLQTGMTPVASKHQLLTTLAATTDATPQYALEGSVFVAGAAVQWLRDGLKLIEAAAKDAGAPLGELRADGGMSRNAWFLQRQADVLGLPVVGAGQSEATAQGAAFLAGLRAGVRTSLDQLRRIAAAARHFEPR